MDKGPIFNDLSVHKLIRNHFQERKTEYTEIFRSICTICEGQSESEKISALIDIMNSVLRYSQKNFPSFIKILTSTVVMQSVLHHRSLELQIELCNMIYRYMITNYAINQRFWFYVRTYNDFPPVPRSHFSLKVCFHILFLFFILKRIFRA